ncbi:ABC transporter ATP-binding protein [soil metagenome]
MSESVHPPLVVSGLVKSYRRATVLRGLDLSAMPGEAVAVVGSNGAGKSTLLGCITGDRLPDSGSIRICGWDPFSDPARAAGCMGFVPEQPFLYPELTVGEMLRFVAEARQMKERAATDEILRLQDLLDLTGAESALCRELSQGMGRKVGIIAALLHRPRLLLLDEAFNGLDRSSSERLSGELQARRDAGAAVVLSSHDLMFLAEWCDRGILLAPGQPSLALQGEIWKRWKQAPTLDPKVASGGT